MIDWDFYSRRSGATLEGFLSSVNSYEEALEKFKKRGLNPPGEEEIMAVFGKKMSKNFTMPNTKNNASKKSLPTKAPIKKRTRKKKDSGSNGKEYFRKVLPTKD